jgi:hypothetical protein
LGTGAEVERSRFEGASDEGGVFSTELHDGGSMPGEAGGELFDSAGVDEGGGPIFGEDVEELDLGEAGRGVEELGRRRRRRRLQVRRRRWRRRMRRMRLSRRRRGERVARACARC